jgi:prepilin-type N-terminal cleavage/methylation domain-containing protein
MTGRRGFTLIEVVIVMAIIAIALSLTGPRIGAGLGRLNLTQSAQTVKRTVKLARLQAERTEREHYVVLNRRNRSVALVNSQLAVLREETLPSTVEIVLDGEAETATVFVSPSGLLRAPAIRLRGRVGEVEVALQ